MKRLFLISASMVIASSAFAQSSRCVNAPLNLSGNAVTLTTSGNKTVTNDQMYIYYASKRHRRHMEDNTINGISARYHSAPLLMSTDKIVNPVAETYNVTLATPQPNVAVCPDSALNLAATINVEKVSSYTGNYPGSNSNNDSYREVSKHHYKMAARKMRKIKKNEAKIARESGTEVDVRTEKA